MHRCILHSLFLLIFPALLRAQLPHAGIELALEHLELEKAGLMALSEKNVKERIYYQSRILFVKYLVTEDPELLPRFLSLAKSSIQTLDKLPDEDPEKNALVAEMFLLRGAAKALNKRYVSSAIDIKSACNLISRNLRKFPDHPTQLKLLGIFHVAMATVPRKMQWLGNVLCFKGDLERGMQELESYASQNNRLVNEAEILLFYFEKNLLDQPDRAYSRIAKLQSRYPKSRLYNYLLLSSYLEMRENDKALALAKDREAVLKANLNAEALPLWHYARAKAHFFKLEYRDCISQLDLFLATYKGRTLSADALYRKGMALILSGDYPAAQIVFHQLTKVEASGFDADEYASQQAAIYMLHEPSATDNQLYEARNLFDGGYYQASMRKLAVVKDKKLSENQSTELFYRLGRNFHAMDSLDVAIQNYTSALRRKPGKNNWMRVYSYYYLARIAEESGDLEAAEVHYKTALTFEDYAYQAGLEQRCKAALQKIRRLKKDKQK